MIEHRTAPFGALLLRLTLGSLFIAHFYWKFAILPGGVQKWWSGLEANGYPWFVPAYVISAELAGSLLLIPGIYTRWVSLYAIPLMIGAAHFWLVRRGFYFTGGGRGASARLGHHADCSSVVRRRSLRPQDCSATVGSTQNADCLAGAGLRFAEGHDEIS